MKNYKTRFVVTKKDIENGVARTSNSCPIALSLNRVAKRLGFKKGCRARVGITIASLVFSSGRRTPILLPEKAQQFISDFDSKRKVKPFSFEVEFSL